MANQITEQRLIDSTKRTLVKYVLVNPDGTQDANTTLLDVSTLKYALNANGVIMSSNTDPKPTYRTAIKRIFGTVHSSKTTGKTGTIALQWEGDTNSTIVVVGSGSFDFDFQSMGDGALIWNPEANSTGDILITTVGLDTADVATIFIDLKKNNYDYDAGQTADPYAHNNIAGM